MLEVLANQSTFIFFGAQVRVSAEKGGFGIFATRNIAKDEVVLTETPYVSYIENIDRSRCSHCAKRLESRVLCSCGEVYCSNQCRHRASVEYHAALCNTSYRQIETFLQQHGRTSSSRQINMVARLLARASIEKPSDKKYSSPLDLAPIHILHRTTDVNSLADLEDSTYNMNIPQPIENYLLIDFLYTENIPSLYRQSNPRIDMDIIVQTSRVLLANTYRVDGSDVNLAVLLAGSFFNHDCNPNAELTTKPSTGNTAYFKTKRDVQEGEELTVSYVDPDEENQMRSLKLLGFYGFRCQCKRCLLEQ